MKFQIDHDYHIHSFLSTCSSDPAETPEAILRYGEENGLSEEDKFYPAFLPL